MCYLLSRVQLFTPNGRYPDRLLCPWDSPCKNTWAGCHFLLQGIFLTQALNPDFPHSEQILHHLSHSQLPVLFLLIVYSYSIFGCKEHNQSDFGVDHLVMFMCRVFFCVVRRECLLWPVHFLGKTLLVFALLHSAFQGQICLLLQVFLDFLLLHSSPL